MINMSDTKDELVDDFVALITSVAARIYGRRQSRRRAEQIRHCVETTYGVADAEADENESPRTKRVKTDPVASKRATITS